MSKLLALLATFLIVASSILLAGTADSRNSAKSEKPFVFSRPPVLPENAKRQMLQNLQTIRGEIARRYEAGDWTAHQKATLGLLRYTRRIPIYYLVQDHQQLLEAVQQYGAAPFLSYVIDYGTRLAYSPTSDDREKFHSLALAFKRAKHKANAEGAIFLRTRSRRSFRMRSENDGWVAAYLLFMKEGKLLTNSGFESEELLRLAGFYRSCTEGREKQAGLSGALVPLRQLDACALLANELASRIGDSGVKGLDNLLADMAALGSRASASQCLASVQDQRTSQLVEQVEAYYGCEQSSRSAGRDKRTWIMDYDIWENPQSDVFQESNTWFGDYQRMTNENGDQIDHGTWFYRDGSTKTIDVNLTTGEWQEVTTNSGGQVTHAEFGNRSGEHGSYNATYNDNGTLSHETIVEKSGNTRTSTEVQYDSAGNMTSSTTETAENNGDGTETVTTETADSDGNSSTSSYVRYASSGSSQEDGYGQNQCAQQLRDSIKSEMTSQKVISRIQPYVNPKPDDTVGAVDDPCLKQFQTTSPSTCKSVWLCLEGQVDEQCRCTGARLGGITNLPPYQGSCQKMMCGEGSACDPQTGACVRSGSGGVPEYSPGLGPPPPATLAMRSFSTLPRVILRNRLRSLFKQRLQGGVSVGKP
ncbi:MAG: hypothetical protein ACRD3A_12640 [Terriglobales bacterium]